MTGHRKSRKTLSIQSFYIGDALDCCCCWLVLTFRCWCKARNILSLSSSTYSQFSMPYATHIKRHIILFWFDCCLCNAVPMWCDVMCVMADADDVMTVKVARASVYDTYVGWWHNMYCWSLMLRAAAAAATVAAAAPKHRIVLVLLS